MRLEEVWVGAPTDESVRWRSLGPELWGSMVEDGVGEVEGGGRMANEIRIEQRPRAVVDP